MYKVLLVDDENWVVESLKSAIEWKKYGFQVVGQANDGMKAFELICNLKPHVVFADVRMPGMNGLELIKKVKDAGMDIQFVIASGYAEFAYAQKALSYGAISYCLKPFEESEIIKSLNKARDIIDERRANTEYQILELLDEDNSDNDAAAGILLKESGMDIGKKEVTVIASVGKEGVKLPDGINYLKFKVGLQKRIYLIESWCSEDLKKYMEKQVSDAVRGIGISGRVKKANCIKNAVNEANAAAYQFFISGTYEARVYDSFKNNPTGINNCMKLLNESIRDRNMAAVEICFNDLSNLFKSGCYNIKHAFFVYNLAMSFVYSNFSDFQESFIDSYELLFGLFKNIGHMFSYLKDHIIGQIGYRSGYEPEEPENYVIKEVIDYVNKNFYKDIYIQNLSEKFFINPNYISRLFKKEVGQNFTEYLSKVRIEYACSLLKETKLSIQQISERTGYHDYFYFARIFKKITGKTPGNYRNEVS